MTFEPARPRHTLPLAGREYDLLGSIELVEAVEYALKKGIGQVAVEVVNEMPSHELAKLLSAVLTACGHRMTPKAASDTLWTDVGLSGAANSELRLHLYAFLSVCLAPPGEREKKARDMGELIGKLEKASRGASTRRRASGASAGSPPSSGGPPPGT